MFYRLCICFSTIIALACPTFAKDATQESVVKIYVTQRPPNLTQPWTKSSPQKTSGSGVIIAGKRILTNAHVVQYASEIFVQPFQTTEKIEANVIATAPDMDLALLSLEDEEIFEDHPPLPIAKQLPKMRDTVNVYGYPVGGDDLSVTEGIVSRIEYGEFYHNRCGGLRIQVDAALNPGNSGGPAVVDDQIVGLVFSKISRADNIGYLIPAEEIEMFLADIQDGTYDAKPTLFDGFQSTENDALRDRLGIDKSIGGVLVGQPYANDADYPLSAWDVITHIGEHLIDSRGKVRLDDDLLLDFHYLIPKLAQDGTVELTVLRDGQSKKVKVPVRHREELLISPLRGADPRYFIHGPLIFTEASQEFVTMMGTRGWAYLAVTRSPLMSRWFDRPSFEGEELVALANRMFPHRTIKGYANAPFSVIEKVNDQPVKNLRHLAELIRDAKGEFITFDLAGRSEVLVFHRAELAASTEDVLSDVGIRYQSSPDLRDVVESIKP